MSIEEDIPSASRLPTRAELVTSILQSIHDVPTLRLERDVPIRSKSVAESVTLLQELFFPGFFGSASWQEEISTVHISSLLNELRAKLLPQAVACLKYESRVKGRSTEQIDYKAAEIIERFFEHVPALREVLASDAQAAYDGDPAAVDTNEIVIAYPGFFAIFVYRMAHVFFTLGLPLIPRMMTEHAHSLTGIDIHPGAQIGRRFFIDHGTGVTIGGTCVIGNNVKIYQGVTLGALSFATDVHGNIIKGMRRHPTIRDSVTIYANATVLGGETEIGEGSVIGGGVFVTRSVPPGHVVRVAAPQLKMYVPSAPAKAKSPVPEIFNEGENSTAIVPQSTGIFQALPPSNNDIAVLTASVESKLQIDNKPSSSSEQLKGPGSSSASPLPPRSEDGKDSEIANLATAGGTRPSSVLSIERGDRESEDDTEPGVMRMVSQHQEALMMDFDWVI